jgi:hypothetical protein
LWSPAISATGSWCIPVVSPGADEATRGTRFRYTFYYPEPPPSDTPAIKLSNKVGPHASHAISESIRALDHEATALLALPGTSGTAAAAHDAFAEYLARTKNTICGRHPIGVLLGTLAELQRTQAAKPNLQFVRYEQSSACRTVSDSSVSYASAYVTIQKSWRCRAPWEM